MGTIEEANSAPDLGIGSKEAQEDLDSTDDLRPIRGFGGQLSVANFNFNIPSSMGTYQHAEEIHGADSWRYKVVKFLHSGRVQVLLMGLLFLDVLILFVEMLFLANYPHCSLIERDAVSCCPAASSSSTAEAAASENEADTHSRFLESSTESHASNSSSSGGHHSDVCAISGGEAVQQFTAGCDEHKWATIHTVEEVLFALTLTILSLFMIELTLSMIALTPQIFFRQFFFLLDFVIVSISLSLEIFFHFKKDDLYQTLVGILVLIRIWRFIRIGHGIVELTNEVAHKEYEHLLEYTEDLRDLLVQNNIPLPPGSEHFFAFNDDDDKDLLAVIKREDRAEHHRKSEEQHEQVEQPSVPDSR